MGLFRRIKRFFRGETKEDEQPVPGRGGRRREGSSSSKQSGAQAEVRGRPPRDLVIGLDWGTSCTKVVVQEPYSADRAAYLIDFESLGHGDKSHLLSSQLFVDRDGAGYLGEKSGAVSFAGLKLFLMDQPNEECGPKGFSIQALPEAWAVLYLARVLQHVREWFLATYKDIYGPYEISWQVNLGIPSASYNEVAVREAFRTGMRVAWWLSLQDEPLTVVKAQEGLKRFRESSLDLGIHPEFIDVVPEVAAQVVGYAKSYSRREGLHLLVDVGASTLDVASFKLSNVDGEDLYSVLTASVVPLGAFRLEKTRLAYIQENGAQYFDTVEAFERWFREISDVVGPLHQPKDKWHQYFPDGIRVKCKPPHDPDRYFADSVYKTLRKAICDLRDRRYPNAPEWRAGLPLFLCGGGKYLHVYPRAVRNLNYWRERHLSVSEFVQKPLPKPRTLIAEGLSPDDYHRFSVAYGLSFPIDDIGHVRTPDEIPDLPTEVRHREKRWQEDMKALT